MSETINKFKAKLEDIKNLEGIAELLEWDQQVNMPPKGSEIKGKQSATISGIAHDMFISNEMGELIKELQKNSSSLNEDDKIILERVNDKYIDSKKVPSEFLRELSKESTNAFVSWEEARKKSDFNIFKPYLEKMVGYSRKLADYIGYEDSPYDALLDMYEKGLTVKFLNPMFDNLKEKIVPFLEAIQNSDIKITDDLMRKFYPKDKQWAFSLETLEKIGYDFKAGRQDLSTHPFTVGWHPNDVRVTTRINENYLSDCISSAIHEGGHALYEQGLLPEYYGTPLCEAVSLGIHESQSRLWENMVGKSKEYWKFFYPKLQEKYFPEVLKTVSMEEFYNSFNCVEPSFIRVDADEVTYNLHIILRYEIERDVLENKIKVKDFPEIWNAKMKEYLGITPLNDSKGVLQDVHWTMVMGYFPSYTLGNLYSAQLFHKIKEDIPNIEENFTEGNFKPLLDWLRKNIHNQGKRYYARDLIKVATGEEPNPDYFTNYIYDKYGEIYGIARMMM